MALTQRQRRSEKITGPKVAAPASTMVRRRIPELAVGVLLMGLFALGALVLFSDATEPVAVVAVGTQVEAGSAIAQSDLVPIGITADSLISPNVVPWGSAEANALVGRQTLVQLPVGTIVTQSMMAPDIDIPDGFRAIGHVVTSDAIPDLKLLTGDRVDLISVAGDDPTMVAESVTIAEIVGGEGRWFVTLQVPVEHEVEVVGLIANNSLRMARLPR